MFAVNENHESLLLTGSVDVSAFHDVRQLLNDAILRGHDFTVDVSQVEAFDLIGLQLLIAAHRSARQVGIAMEISLGSHPLTEACSIYAIPPSELGLELVSI